MFSATFFENNRKKIRNKFDKHDLLVFAANGLLQRSGSTSHPYKQDSNFWYLCGVEESDVLLVMEATDTYLIVPKRAATFEKFNGKISNAEFTQKSGITKIYNYDEGLKKLKTAVLKTKSIATCLPLDDYVEAAGFYANPARRKLMVLLTEINPGLEFVDARPQLSKLRMIKTEDEIHAIENAISISAQAFETIKKNIRDYKTEKQIISALTGEFLANGASGHAYDPIVASGGNACVLHYQSKDNLLKSDSLVLIDAGAEANNYASDITRTYSLSTPSQRQAEVYDAVMKIRNYALGAIRLGTIFKDYETSVKNFSKKVIKGLKLNNQDYAKYYPHATSHFLGLDVHDAADYQTDFKPNMVITVEPGIYIEEEGIGIRIEDDILITKDGYRNLSHQIHRELI